MVSIRPATDSDAEAIARVHIESWRTTYSGIISDEFLAALNTAGRVLLWRDWLTREIAVYVAVLDGEIVGFISGGPIREPILQFDAELYAIYLLQGAQGQRIGTALLRELAAFLMSIGFTSMIAWVLESNPSKRFYLKADAQLITSKEIEIGGTKHTELAYGWPELQPIA
jgi:ribosomal protein S18 acetylase RimI-like enzyme